MVGLSCSWWAPVLVHTALFSLRMAPCAVSACHSLGHLDFSLLNRFYPDLAGVIFSQLILHFVAACIITMICVQVFFTLPAVIA